MGEVDQEVYLVYLLLISGLPMLAAVTGYVMGDRMASARRFYPAIFLLSYGATAVFFSLYAAAEDGADLYGACGGRQLFRLAAQQRRIRDILAGKRRSTRRRFC
jgi:hypothetical protein